MTLTLSVAPLLDAATWWIDCGASGVALKSVSVCWAKPEPLPVSMMASPHVTDRNARSVFRRCIVVIPRSGVEAASVPLERSVQLCAFRYTLAKTFCRLRPGR